MYRQLRLLLTLLASSVVHFVHASDAEMNQNVSRADMYHKRRRPHSVSYILDPDEESTNTPSSNIQCKSIIAIGKTTLWTDQVDAARSTDRFHHSGEEFVCERYNESDVPIQGTHQQIQELRDLLNNGTLVSAESTIEVYQQETTRLVTYNTSEQDPRNHVKLPPGNIILKQPQQQRGRSKFVYEGEKPVLAIRVIDKDGLAVEDDAKTISDKIFGSYGDTSTMTSQFAACSFNKLKITSQGSRNIQKVLSAPGVLEVNIGISITDIDQGSMRNAVYQAAGEKLGVALPGPFQHVMFILEGCYKDCGWAAYAYVNSWLSVYQGPFYKFPGVQMHELGHNMNLGHSGGIDKETYTDHTCLMGNPLYSDTVAKMCYNQAKNFQLAQAGAWFSKSHIATFDSGRKGGTHWTGRLFGAAEYDINTAGNPIAVKLVTGSSRDLFIGFNRATGPNADNQQASDAVTITEAGNGAGYSQSYIKALLGSGHDMTLPNWRGSGQSLTVTVNEINSSVRPGYADITITFGSQSKDPTRNPTLQPSKQPALTLPTYSPTFLPTISDEEGSLQTGNTGTLDKAVKGLMFKVKAKKDITILSFDLYSRRNGKSEVTIYTKLGDYQVNTRQSGWNIVYKDTIQLSRVGTTMEGLAVEVAAGSTQSFFVYINTGMRITTTASPLQPYSQDDAMIIYSGTLFRREFYNTVGYGQFAGAIKYDME
ncbi:hypothetical protein ACHAXN_006705 [Cyclotella atomus]